MLARAGSEVHFLLHSDYDYVLEHGLHIDSFRGPFSIDRPNVYRSAADMPVCDIVLVGLKTTNNRLLPGLLAHVAGPHTLVLLIQNGIGVEADVEAAVPGAQLAAGLAFICSAKSVGFDGLLNFYEGRNAVCDLPMERALLNHLGWTGNLCAPAPYVIDADRELTDRIAGDDMVRGVTVACGGFFGPQGRRLRVPLADPRQNEKIESFEYNGLKITNFEMESSALAGLARLMGHKATTCCMVIANRVTKKSDTGYKSHIDDLIKLVLDRI